jgi:tRNA pseudouridine38-40 synthase
LEYDGTDFHGWQVQPGLRTVQGELEEALKILFQEPLRVVGAGRTDGGVHALGQVANFKIEKGLSLNKIQEGGNSLLPIDLSIKKTEEVPLDFNARFAAKKKVYRYEITRVKSPIRRRFSWQIGYDLDLKRMEEGAKQFIGEHDFTSFSKNGDSISSDKSSGDSPISHIYHCEWSKTPNSYIFEIEGVRFLRYMARIIVGTLVDLGRGRFSTQEIQKILDARDRTKAGPTAPPQGLCLVEVKY